MSEKNEWKPIESAPKDGTEILVFHPQGGVCAAFCPVEGFAWHCMDGMNTVIGKKSRQSIPVMTSFVEPPTHWMPLPAAPGSPASTVATEGEKDERQAFEAWAEDNGFVLDCDFFETSGQYYEDNETQLAYDIWRAARASVAAPAAGDAREVDPLQGAANWLAVALGGIDASMLQRHLVIGHNRAQRLYDAAIAQQSQRKEA